jgi:hypothetical protein
MGSVKDRELERHSKDYERNRYNSEVRKLRERMRIYEDNTLFVAKLERELAGLQLRRKEYLALRKDKETS